MNSGSGLVITCLMPVDTVTPFTSGRLGRAGGEPARKGGGSDEPEA